MNRRTVKIIKIVVFFHLFVAVALMLTHCSFTRYAKKSYESAKAEIPFDVIIVPGVPFEHENTTSVMKMRIFWAKHLFDSGFTRNIIFSGSAVYSPFVESIIMKVVADSLGIPSDHTFSEQKAEHSTENVYYSWKLARVMGFEKIALATDPFQSRLLGSFIRKYCPEVTSIPIVFDMLDVDNLSLPLIDTTAAYVPGFVSITKREGFWERFRGTMGKRIKEEISEEKEGIDQDSWETN
jgi:uncharacterized SAM-binding protein YcdF (DUF218 family)